MSYWYIYIDNIRLNRNEGGNGNVALDIYRRYKTNEMTEEIEWVLHETKWWLHAYAMERNISKSMISLLPI